ncbi:hypothetical protein AKO1_002212, partial [Acrasis kona]
MTFISSRLISDSLPGEAPISLAMQGTTIVAQSQSSSGLNSQLNYTIPNGGLNSSAAISLNGDLAKDSTVVDSITNTSRSISSTDTLSVNIALYAFNPFSYVSDSSVNLTSSVLSMSVLTNNGSNIRVYNTTKPITLTIPGTFNVSLYSTNTSSLKNGSWVPTPVCAYWDIFTNSWQTDGVKLISFSQNAVVCQANHLTDFSVQQLLVQIQTNTLIPVASLDFLSLVKNSYSIPLVICIIVGLSYVACLAASIALDYKVDRKFTKDVLDNRDSYGLWRRSLEAIRTHHLWLSAIFLSSTEINYTRPQRVT